MVHFVGAGCGAADLITLRGKRLLDAADVIVYAGSLVNPELLKDAKTGVQIYDSAKMTLDEVLSVMISAAEKGLEVVRLHSGDSSLYGAIGEQMEILDSCHILYDVCPGVSSFCGAAASLKTEYTLPGISQSVIITRISGNTGAVPEDERIRSLARHHSTMVIFLSTGHLVELEKELLAGGLEPDTPAVIVYKASWPEEKICRCTISSLWEMAQREGIQRTALVCVGKVFDDRKKILHSRLYAKDYSTLYREGQKADGKEAKT